MRRVVITLVLVIILWAVFRLDRMAENWHYVLPAEPGELLYVASFDDDAPDWEQEERNDVSSQLVEGMMRVSVNVDDDGLYSVASPYFGDFDMQVAARVRQGVFDGDNNNGYGVIFRQYDRKNYSIFRQDDRKNYFIFLVSNDGSYRIMRVVDDRSFLLSDWITTDAIHTLEGVANQLRVIGDGDHFQFYINGERMQLCIPDDPDGQSTMYDGSCIGGSMQDTLVDDSISFGRLGVAIQSDVGWPIGVVVDFDNVIVYGPQPIADNE